MDTGFIVFNDRTYPILNRFFRELGVSIRKSDMSFGYFHEKSGFQYASTYLNSLFAQRRNILSSGYWSTRTIIDKLRLRADEHLLEIGCGWGGFAIKAVQRTGCLVTGISISRDQYHFARQRVTQLGFDRKFSGNGPTIWEAAKRDSASGCWEICSWC